MPNTEQVSTDILIIGGGSAGCMAAIRASEVAPDLRVTIFEKGTVRHSGCIAMGMDALNNVVVPGVTTEEQYVEAINMVMEGICDPAPQRVIAHRGYGIAQKLESWGVKLRHRADGVYYTHSIHPNGAYTVPMDAPELKGLLAGKTEEHGVTAFDRTMAVALLTDVHGVSGAVALNVRTGELIVCLAKAVIMTGGGCARFGLPNTGYLFGTVDFPGNAGDGYAIGYHAGARVTGMEYTVAAAIVKDLGTPLLVPAQSHGAILVNSRGEPVQGTRARAHASSDMWESNRAATPLFIRTKHLPEENIREIEKVLFSTERPAQKRFYEGRGVNLRERDIELGPTEHYLCGGHGAAGLDVDEQAETSLPGLYAAGDAAGVPYQYLVGAFVLGEVAAENAAVRVRTRLAPELDSGQVAAIEKTIAAAAEHRPGARASLDEFEYKVRRIVNEYVVSPKNAWRLQNAVDWMHRFRGELVEVAQANDPHEVARYLELGYIIDSAELSAVAALTRCESRWGPKHFRADYPQRDDENWLKRIVMQSGADGSVQVECLPVPERSAA